MDNRHYIQHYNLHYKINVSYEIFCVFEKKVVATLKDDILFHFIAKFLFKGALGRICNNN